MVTAQALMHTQKKIIKYMKPTKKNRNLNFMMAAALEAAINKKLSSLKTVVIPHSKDYIDFLAT